jgi:hypothetical protein
MFVRPLLAVGLLVLLLAARPHGCPPASFDRSSARRSGTHRSSGTDRRRRRSTGADRATCATEAAEERLLVVALLADLRTRPTSTTAPTPTCDRRIVRLVRTPASLRSSRGLPALRSGRRLQHLYLRRALLPRWHTIQRRGRRQLDRQVIPENPYYGGVLAIGCLLAGRVGRSDRRIYHPLHAQQPVRLFPRDMCGAWG